MRVGTFTIRPLQLLPAAVLFLGLIWLAAGQVARGAAAQADFCDSVSQIPKGECEALELLYNAAGGDGWTDNSGWLSSVTPCDDWIGVACSSGQVFQISLPTNNLSNSLPVGLAALTEIQILELNHNVLSGGLPSDLVQMTSLRRLNLSNNEFSGSLPNNIGNLNDLRELSLGFNMFTGEIPGSLNNLDDLTILELVANQFDGAIPGALGGLERVEWVDLGTNKLTGEIPAELADPSDLQTLFLDGNQLEGDVPSALCNANNLVFATLDFNRLETETADPCVKQKVDTDWEQSQTLPPESVLASTAGEGQVQLSWSLVEYRANPGHYEIYSSQSSGGPYQKEGQTANKNETEFLVTDLTPGQVYFFVIRTVTDPHTANPNTLVSRESIEISSSPVAVTLADFGVETAGGFWPPAIAALLLAAAAATAFLLWRGRRPETATNQP